jgi:hypothetical protein
MFKKSKKKVKTKLGPEIKASTMFDTIITCFRRFIRRRGRRTKGESR